MINYNLFGEEVSAVTQTPKKRIGKSENRLVNVASVPQRSPFRYPGGKTWLIPTVRQWLKQNVGPSRSLRDGGAEGRAAGWSDPPAARPVPLLIEPFCGGGIVSLTAAFEHLAQQVLMTELDPEIAAVWQVIFSSENQWLAERILHFDLTLENAKAVIEKPDKQLCDLAFSTILKNRIYHGGIIAKGSAPLKNGENGRGIKSRWYAQTLYDRITTIQQILDRVSFRQEDAFQILEEYRDREDCYFFIDPPYTVAGKRLYTFYDLDHAKLFEYTARLRGRFMLTYDDTPEIRHLAERFGLAYKTIPMKTTHHLEKQEILITDNLNW